MHREFTLNRRNGRAGKGGTEKHRVKLSRSVFSLEWMGIDMPSPIAFPRIRAHPRTAFCYFFFTFIIFTTSSFLIQVSTLANNERNDCTITNHVRYTSSNTRALFQIVFARNSPSIFNKKFSYNSIQSVATANWTTHYFLILFPFLYLSPTNIDNRSRLSSPERKLSAVYKALGIT